jgi:PIN domain nuclease of toxin-antitoxin system
VREQLTINRVSLLPLRFEHAAQVSRLPWHHRDPLDRLIVAQAQCESLPLLTSDAQLEFYGIPIIC